MASVGGTERKAAVVADRWLTGPAKTWLGVVTTLSTVDGAIWFAFPNLVQSPAYQLAYDVAPVWVWGLLMSAAGMAGWWALWKDGHRWAPEAARFSIAAYGLVTAVVGISIFALTFAGSTSALTGASKWLGLAGGCLMALAGPAVVGPTRVTIRDWFVHSHQKPKVDG